MTDKTLIRPDSKPRRQPGFFLDQENEETCLLHESHDGVITLNEFAVLVWRMCDGKRSIEENIVLLQGAYPDEKAQIPPQVYSVILELLEVAALTLEE